MAKQLGFGARPEESEQSRADSEVENEAPTGYMGVLAGLPGLNFLGGDNTTNSQKNRRIGPPLTPVNGRPDSALVPELLTKTSAEALEAGTRVNVFQGVGMWSKGRIVCQDPTSGVYTIFYEANGKTDLSVPPDRVVPLPEALAAACSGGGIGDAPNLVEPKLQLPQGVASSGGFNGFNPSYNFLNNASMVSPGFAESKMLGFSAQHGLQALPPGHSPVQHSWPPASAYGRTSPHGACMTGSHASLIPQGMSSMSGHRGAVYIPNVAAMVSPVQAGTWHATTSWHLRP